MTTGKSIRLFLEDGTPGGLISAEIVNWTGSVVTAPRSDLARLIQRPEARGTGVYILVGDDQDKLGGEIAYIGEADDISKRLRQHAKDQDSGGKDFWLRAVIITSKDTNLTKAHVRYLESRLITIANQAQRMALVNSTAPSPPPLPEADISDMEFFIEQLKIVLPVLNLNILRTRTKTNIIENKDNNVQGNSPIFKLKIAKENITAQAQEIDGEFTVLEGSQGRQELKISKTIINTIIKYLFFISSSFGQCNFYSRCCICKPICCCRCYNRTKCQWTTCVERYRNRFEVWEMARPGFRIR